MGHDRFGREKSSDAVDKYFKEQMEREQREKAEQQAKEIRVKEIAEMFKKEVEKYNCQK